MEGLRTNQQRLWWDWQDLSDLPVAEKIAAARRQCNVQLGTLALPGRWKHLGAVLPYARPFRE